LRRKASAWAITEKRYNQKRACALAGLSPAQWRCLFQALIKQESRFNITSTSPVGAYGLTQLMSGTASDMGVDPNLPIENLRGGTRCRTGQRE